MQPPPDPLIMEDALRELRMLVDAQAEDAALWMQEGLMGVRSSSVYLRCAQLQRALRKLHYVIERETRWI